MLKTMKNQMLPERGEGCRCKGKTPKTFMCVYVCHLKLRKYEWISHFLLENILLMEVEHDFR